MQHFGGKPHMIWALCLSVGWLASILFSETTEEQYETLEGGSSLGNLLWLKLKPLRESSYQSTKTAAVNASQHYAKHANLFMFGS